MSGIYNTINIGLSGLIAHRQALNTSANNLANANTEGYRKQTAVLTSAPGYPTAGSVNSVLGGQWGSGVVAVGAQHSHESYIDLQARLTDSALGRWNYASSTLSQVESIIQPSTDSDIASQLDAFWSAWQDVSNQPEDLGSRYALQQQAVTLANAFQDSSQRLQSLRTSTDLSISSRIDEVNTYTKQIASLNQTIATAQAEGRFPNDELDQRDVLIDKLATLTGAMPFTAEDGNVTIYADGRPLVQGGKSYDLSYESTTNGIQITSSFDGGSVEISNGEIGGLIQARDVSIPSYLQQLDTLASAVVTQVNALHETGYGLDNSTGNDFFVAGGTASTIAVSQTILDDVQTIAAGASTDTPGDGSIALSISNLSTTSDLNGRTIGEYARALIGLVGDDVSNASAQVDSYTAAQQQIATQQESISGVSTDEEMAETLVIQRAYEACAKLIQIGDEMIQTVLTMVGNT